MFYYLYKTIMNKKIWRWLLLLFLLAIVILSIQVNSLQAKLAVRESAIENLVDETGVELIREFRQAVDQVKSWKATMSKICKEWRGVLPAKDFNLYCG